ncbi:MAG: response regulator transcription factor [Anaerolineae bacterium]|nr:response regulator transcription factor [Anaerolineae bacterium]
MANKRLLIIEDDYDVAEMLVMYFMSHQYEVHHADSGEAGVEMARSKFPQLILLDVMMPDIDGYETCLRIRNMALTKYIPIIFLTQRDERANKVKGLELGADDYVTKPFDIDELRLRVQAAIRRATRESLHETRTGLPTGPLVEEEIARHQYQGKAFTLLHLGLNDFTPYRDVYGFVAANEVFAFAARAIQQTVAQKGTMNDFVGVADDHFILLTYASDASALQGEIQSQFSEGVKAFYSFADVERGGLLMQAGTEEEHLYPLVTLATLDAPV